jgi:hypothetical protein
MDWNTFRDFLRSLNVEMEGSSDGQRTQPPHEEPTLTILQKSHDHEALYRIDLVETIPQLLVLIPTNQAPVKFHFYQVLLSETHPLHSALAGLIGHRGSDLFEQEREVAVWQQFQALVESMKALFWAGQETAQFPPEITVQKIL